MNKLIKSLLVVAGVALAGSASADQNVVKISGICAGNALKLKQVATEVLATKPSPDVLSISQQASRQISYFQTRFGNQPAFKEAATFSYNHSSTMEDRLRMLDGCAKVMI